MHDALIPDGGADPSHAAPELGRLFPRMDGTTVPLSDAELRGESCPYCHQPHLLSELVQQLGPLSRLYFCPSSDRSIPLGRVDRSEHGWFWVVDERFALDPVT